MKASGHPYTDFLYRSKGVPVLPAEPRRQAPREEQQDKFEQTAFGKPKPKVDARIFVDLRHALEKRDPKAYQEAHRRAHRKRGDAGDDPSGNRDRRDSRNVDHEIDKVIKPIVDKDPDGVAEFLARVFPSEEFKNAEAYGVVRTTDDEEDWDEKCVLSINKMEACVQQIWALSKHGWPVVRSDDQPTDMDDWAGDSGW
eukprot:CAMPEP_0113820504 /NCGR_PEP_ID=MMETSP0328-20130328/1274_1 /TAXON_ID=39455 /ORGANISM="Alexandrium minutum" /LENGTH=197 /DNA_ID=CAMNT_0000788441 /DNA_START=151 /DNA_END=741 /DNA_ORIENTATION=- /assembly_acc=CAM_ASM_000350